MEHDGGHSSEAGTTTGAQQEGSSRAGKGHEHGSSAGASGGAATTVYGFSELPFAACHQVPEGSVTTAGGATPTATGLLTNPTSAAPSALDGGASGEGGGQSSARRSSHGHGTPPQSIPSEESRRQSSARKGRLDSSSRAGDDILELTDEDALPDRTLLGPRLWASRKPLFTHAPTLRDVRQGAVGDCYLIAAIDAILSKPGGAALIQAMMREDHDGSIVVRFFRERADAPQHLDPEYIRVKTSVLERGVGGALRRRGAPQASGALWVKVLEKAWAAHRKSPKVQSYYRTNDGGTVEDVALAFLGQRARSVEIVSYDTRKIVPWKRPPALGNARAGHLDWLAADVFHGGPRDSQQVRLAKATRWTQLLEAANPTIWQRHERPGEPASDPRMSDLTSFCREMTRALQGEKMQQGFPDGAALLQEAKDYVEQQRLLPGKRGTGIYTASQRAIYEEISGALAAGEVVGISSRETVGETRDGTGHSGGEAISKGLVGQHAHAIVAAEKGRKLWWIKLMNPRGYLGRELTPRTDEARAAEGVRSARAVHQGTFWVELSDLTKRFHNCRLCGTILLVPGAAPPSDVVEGGDVIHLGPPDARGGDSLDLVDLQLDPVPEGYLDGQDRVLQEDESVQEAW
jgi:calpain family cysteine protease